MNESEEDAQLSMSVHSQLRISNSTFEVPHFSMPSKEVEVPSATCKEAQSPAEMLLLTEAYPCSERPYTPPPQPPVEQTPSFSRVPTLDLKALTSPSRKKRNSSSTLVLSPQPTFTPRDTVLSMPSLEQGPRHSHAATFKADAPSLSVGGQIATSLAVQTQTLPQVRPPANSRQVWIPRFLGPKGFFKGVLPPPSSVPSSHITATRTSLPSTASVPIAVSEVPPAKELNATVHHSDDGAVVAADASTSIRAFSRSPSAHAVGNPSYQSDAVSVAGTSSLVPSPEVLPSLLATDAMDVDDDFAAELDEVSGLRASVSTGPASVDEAPDTSDRQTAEVEVQVRDASTRVAGLSRSRLASPEGVAEFPTVPPTSAAEHLVSTLLQLKS